MFSPLHPHCASQILFCLCFNIAAILSLAPMLSLFPLLGVVYGNGHKLTLKNGLESVIFSFKIFCVFSWYCSSVRENLPGVRDALDLIPSTTSTYIQTHTHACMWVHTHTWIHAHTHTFYYLHPVFLSLQGPALSPIISLRTIYYNQINENH